MLTVKLSISAIIDVLSSGWGLLEKRLEAKKGVKKVYLAPFMLVAGDHATNDLCSDEESWYFFTKKGYQVGAHLIKLGEYPSVQEYVQHLEKIIK